MFSFGLGALTSSRRISALRFNSSAAHEQESQPDFSLMLLLSGLTVTVRLICDLLQRFTVGAPGAEPSAPPYFDLYGPVFRCDTRSPVWSGVF